jgi:hypothetical protein
MSGADSSLVDQKVLKTVMASFVQIITALLLRNGQPSDLKRDP